LYDASGRSHYNYFRDFDPATGRYVEKDPAGLAGGLNPYAYVRGNPISGRDPYGLSSQDVANAWTWLQQNYPDLTNSVSSVSGSPLLNESGYADGFYNPFNNSIAIAKSYYTTPCLSDTQKSHLLQVLAHEALHVYLDGKIGAWDYFEYNYRSGYHTWIVSTAAAISSYYDGMVVPGTPPPSINTYPDQFFDQNDY
jgi:RHS repeat-associated protein